MAAPRRTPRSLNHEARQPPPDLVAHRERLESIGRLSSGLAHDFNNLLTVVYTYCALLERCVREDTSALGYVGQIEAAVQRGAELTRNVLEFARPTSRGKRCVDVNDVVQRIGGMLERLLGDSIVVKTVTERSLRVVQADLAQLEQILINLALNARDAMAAGGTLEIRTEGVTLETSDATVLGVPAGDHVLISVSDTGHGMDAATSQRVFEPFFTTKGGQGMGLGLSTARDAVRSAKGAIAVESTVGRGTTFRIWLPVASDRTTEPRALITARPPPNARYTLVLLEPSRAIRAPLAEYLRLRGFDVLEAEGGAEVVEHAKRHPRPLDVLVADPAAPRIRERSVAVTLELLCPNMKALYVLRESDPVARDALSALPRGLILQKPFPPETLLSSILTLLEDAPVSDREPEELVGE